MKYQMIKSGWSFPALAVALGFSLLFSPLAFADGGPIVRRLPQDAKTVLATARTSLDTVAKNLQTLQSGGFGGYIDQAETDLADARAGLDAATKYIAAHPEANQLLSSSEAKVGATTSSRTFTNLGRGPFYGGVQLLNTTHSQVGNVEQTMSNPTSALVGQQPNARAFLGELDGNREKIMVALEKVNGDLQGAYNYYSDPIHTPSAVAVTALGKYQGKVTIELVDGDGPTIIEIPKSLVKGTASADKTTPASASLGDSGSGASGNQPYVASDAFAANLDDSTADELPMRSLLPSIIASVALSGAMILGGLYFFSRKGRMRLNTPAVACLMLVGLMLGVGILHGDLLPVNTDAPPPAPPPPPPPPPPQGVSNTASARGFAATRGATPVQVTPAPHVSGDAVVYMETSGDTVHIILTRKNAADLLGQPPQR